jgi:hypothetical protein
MKYREFGKTGVKVSALGFGCMRFPLLRGSEDLVDEDESIKMIRYGIDNGINYIDTAWPYHKGMSEEITGRALLDGYREKINLATKMPSWLIKTRVDMDSYLEKQLQRLQTDCIDFYLIHALNSIHWPNLKKLGLFDFIEKALSSGKIKHIGFSFHDELPIFKEIIEGYNWEFCQFQYNFMDVNFQAGLEGLEYAAERDLGVVIMEPLRGGAFLTNIPDNIDALWKSSSEIKSPADTALRFIWDHPGVSTILSGMSNMRQLTENLESSDRADINRLGDDEREIVEKVNNAYKARIIAPCTNCKYCMPCPSGVDIPRNLKYLNDTSMLNSVKAVLVSYRVFFNEAKKADKCVQCGECEEACPQNIHIIDSLKQLVEVMS